MLTGFFVQGVTVRFGLLVRGLVHTAYECLGQPGIKRTHVAQPTPEALRVEVEPTVFKPPLAAANSMTKPSGILIPHSRLVPNQIIRASLCASLQNGAPHLRGLPEY